MSKPTIFKWWIWGAVALCVGGIGATASSLILVARVVNDQAGKTGSAAEQAVSTDYLFWTLIAFIVLAGTIAGAGLIGQSVAWWGAIFNARSLPDKTWYKVELWSGIGAAAFALIWLPVSVAIVLITHQSALWAWYLPGGVLAIVIGWCAMIPYLAVAPDSTAAQPVRVIPPQAALNGHVRRPSRVGSSQ